MFQVNIQHTHFSGAPCTSVGYTDTNNYMTIHQQYLQLLHKTEIRWTTAAMHYHNINNNILIIIIINITIINKI